MSTQNKLVGREPAKSSQTTEYLSNGETVILSPNLIRKYLVSGGGNVSDQEVMMFLSLCKFQHLNPFLREAYLIKYGDRQPATMVVGKDVFLKRARHHEDFSGIQAGIIIQDNETGDIEEREGSFYLATEETIVGGWAKCFIKGYDVPFYVSVPMDEYIGKKKDGEVNSQWSGKPATMIRKVAVAQVLKEAFPDDNAGMYAPEEIPEATEIALDENIVITDQEPAKIEEKPEQVEMAAELDPAVALFGEV